MASPRLATFTVDGAHEIRRRDRYRHRRSLRAFRQGYPTLREAIADGALTKLAEDAARHPPDHALDAITWQPPIPRRKRSSASASTIPDRNAEYKDGQDAPKYPSMFMRTPRSFVGHGTPLVRPRASPQLDYEGEVVLVIGKAGRHIPKATRSITSPR